MQVAAIHTPGAAAEDTIIAGPRQVPAAGTPILPCISASPDGLTATGPIVPKIPLPSS